MSFAATVTNDYHDLKAEGQLTHQEILGLLAQRHRCGVPRIKKMLAQNDIRGPLPLRKIGIGAFALVATIALIRSATERPSESQIALKDYDRLCASSSDYRDNCKGKFVDWSGNIEQGGDGFVRVNFGDTVSMDVQGSSLKSKHLVEGQRVRVSGWIGQRHFFHPDMDSGEITPTESLADATSRHEAAVRQQRIEEAANRARAEAEARKDDAIIGSCAALGMGNSDATQSCISRIRASSSQ